MVNLAVAGLLLAHGLIHAAFLSPRPPATAGGPQWPFDLDRSPLLATLHVGGVLTRPLGIALVTLTIGGYALAVVAALGVAPALWAAGVAIGSVASLALLGLFFHRYLVLGVVIDVALLYLVLAVGWAPETLPL